jgi:hypothetical protein
MFIVCFTHSFCVPDLHAHGLKISAVTVDELQAEFIHTQEAGQEELPPFLLGADP